MMISVGCRIIHCWCEFCEDAYHQIGSKRLCFTPVKPGDSAGTPWQRTFPSLFSCLLSALRACIMRPWLAWTGSNCNAFCCSVTIWILMPSCPRWARLTIWKPEGNKSLYIMRDLKVPQSVISAPNNEWANTSLCREGRFGTLTFWSHYSVSVLLQNTHSVYLLDFYLLKVVYFLFLSFLHSKNIVSCVLVILSPGYLWNLLC